MNTDKQGERRSRYGLGPICVCSCLSAFIRVYPRLLLLVCLGSGGRIEKKWDMNWNFVGVDFGQARDYTAIAVLERAELRGKYDYAVRAYEKEVALRLRCLFIPRRERTDSGVWSGYRKV